MSHNTQQILIFFWLQQLRSLKKAITNITRNLAPIFTNRCLLIAIASSLAVACSSAPADSIAQITETQSVTPSLTIGMIATPMTPLKSSTASSTQQSTIMTSSPVPSPRMTAAATMTPTPAPSQTPNPYAGLSIEELAARKYGGGLLDIVDTVETDESFTRYLITYPSDGLSVYGFMNVPNEGSKFPVAIVLHGYVEPSQYQTLAYTTRYADALAEAGYFVIHPNFRNYPPSDDGPDPFRIGFAADVLNLIEIIRHQSLDPTGFLRRADRDQIHLFGHSMGGGVALRVVTINNEPYLGAAVLYGSMSGDEQLNYKRIQEWSEGAQGQFELEAPAEQLAAISPIYHLDRIQAAIGIHHSLQDQVVPYEWSDELCRRLGELQKEVECFSYENQSHTFHGWSDTLLVQRAVDLFNER